MPIPGTRNIDRLLDNAGAMSVVLSKLELDEINQLIPIDSAFGMRYPEAMMASLDK